MQRIPTALFILFIFSSCVLSYFIFFQKSSARVLSNLDLTVNEWPSNGNSIEITGIAVPTSVVEDVKKVFAGDPQTWRARDFAPLIKDVIWLFDKDGHCLVFLQQPQRWVRLNDRRGIPYISNVINATSNQLEGEALPMSKLSCLYLGYDGEALTQNLLKLNDENHYIGPKSRDLYADMIHVENNDFEYKVKLLTSRGSIDHWVIKGAISSDKQLKLTNIIVTQLEPEKTYDFPVVGGFN